MSFKKYQPLKYVARLTLATSLVFGATALMAEDAPPIENANAFSTMGYAMGQQLRLNIGFSAEELDLIFEGMKSAAMGAEQPENFEADIQEAQTIYMGKMQAWQAIEEQKMNALANENKAEATAFFATLEGQEGISKTDSGLYYKMVSEGNGTKPSEADRVIVNYRGTLIDGTEFDANDGAEFAVGQVVPGFKEGLLLMSEGAKVELYIPSELGYGDRPQRPGSTIEPGDALIFTVELLEVKKAPKPPSMPPSMGRPPAGMPKGPPAGGPPNYTPPPPPNYTPPPPPGLEK